MTKIDIENALFRIKSYIHYLVRARHSKGHGVHSPYVFALLNDVIFEKNRYYAYDVVEPVRTALAADKTHVDIEPIGTSARTGTTIGREAGVSSKPARYAQLLHRLAIHNKASVMLEFGTNLGLSTMYMALANTKARVYTIEGQHAIAAIAKSNFDAANIRNIHVVEGKIDGEIDSLLATVDHIDLVYIDANHRYEPTMRYYGKVKAKTSNGSIVVIDDPHWSAEMEQAWNTIVRDPQATVTLDLYQMGIVVFNHETHKQHYIVRF